MLQLRGEQHAERGAALQRERDCGNGFAGRRQLGGRPSRRTDYRHHRVALDLRDRVLQRPEPPRRRLHLPVQRWLREGPVRQRLPGVRAHLQLRPRGSLRNVLRDPCERYRAADAGVQRGGDGGRVLAPSGGPENAGPGDRGVVAGQEGRRDLRAEPCGRRVEQRRYLHADDPRHVLRGPACHAHGDREGHHDGDP